MESCGTVARKPTLSLDERQSSREEPDNRKEEKKSHVSLQSLVILFSLVALAFATHTFSAEVTPRRIPTARKSPATAAAFAPLVYEPNETHCFATCKLRIAESLPAGLSFDAPPLSTFDAWKRLILEADKELVIAAYKSSLQGKHVLGELAKVHSREGDEIYELLLKRGISRNVSISMVESYPPKDKGDNEDGMLLAQAGAANRRYLTISEIMSRGKMHSKFLLADRKSFYLGSANLDWRSLNQKMELGVLVEDCPCLGQDLQRIYDGYWGLTNGLRKEAIAETAALYTREKPLTMQIDGVSSSVYIASSPRELNNGGRTHDLDAIVRTIDEAQDFVYIHVMDYFPLFVYRKPQAPWNVIDGALRNAILRGVKVKILTAALHYPRLITSFLRSLRALDGAMTNVTIEARVFKVPAPEGSPMVINRERRTHKKLLVTEKSVLIGNSNWSGDYFEGGTTGTAIVMRQNGSERPLVTAAVSNFMRDFESEYAHPVDEYYENCILAESAEYCETKKDPRLFADRK